MTRSASTHKEAGIIVYLQEELTDARMRCDQLKKFVDRAVRHISDSPQRDTFYEVAGDLIYGIPDALFRLDKALDATALAAARLDYEELKQSLKPEKVELLEEVLKGVRVRHLDRRAPSTIKPSPEGLAFPQEKTAMFKAASKNRVAEALYRIASGVEAARLSPVDATMRLHRVLMALAQTPDRAVQAMGPIQANSREKVMEGFKSANPDLTDEQLEEIADQWEKNKDVVKDKSAAGGEEEALSASEATRLPVGSIVAVDRSTYLVIVPGGAAPITVLPKKSGEAYPDGESLSQWGSKFYMVVKGKGKLPTHATAQQAAIVHSKENPQLKTAAGENKDVVKDKQAANRLQTEGDVLNAALVKCDQVFKDNNLVLSRGWQDHLYDQMMMHVVSWGGNTAAKTARYEEGKPADPTQNMSEEDAAEWRKQTEENRGNFKST